MKNCFYIPRILVPNKERKQWNTVACDRYLNERSYWENESASRGPIPSALNLILPEVFLGENDEEEIARMREEMYTALESDTLEKLVRGWVMVERKMGSRVRRGLVGAVDLECFSFEGGESRVRSLQSAPEPLIRAYLKQRENAPIEMPHIVIVYDDSKNKTINALLKEELEELYDYKTENGSIKGHFLPEELAEQAAESLISRAQNFYVVEGVAAAEAAKLHWQKVKAGLSKGEMGQHPARFMLAELMNLSDDAVEVQPVHRLVKETESEAFLDYFAKKFKCEKRGKVLVPKLSFDAESIRSVDETIQQFLHADGGRVAYIHGEERLMRFAQDEGCAGVLMPKLKKEALFKEVKGGLLLPAYSVCIGGAEGARHYVEAREISYD